MYRKLDEMARIRLDSITVACSRIARILLESIGSD